MKESKDVPAHVRQNWPRRHRTGGQPQVPYLKEGVVTRDPGLTSSLPRPSTGYLPPEELILIVLGRFPGVGGIPWTHWYMHKLLE